MCMLISILMVFDTSYIFRILYDLAAFGEATHSFT